MSKIIAFDVYGTLIDTHGVTRLLEQWVGTQAFVFSKVWRDKQLEYSFRRGLMQNYQPFVQCTRDALEYTSQYLRVDLSSEQKDQLMLSYRCLPAFDDVAEGLNTLQNDEHRLFAFSNGTNDAVNKLLENAKIRAYFEGVVSVDDIKSFKPSPAVYAYFLRQAAASANEAWLVSSNSFDVIGAISAGMKAMWMRRSDDTVFDPFFDVQGNIEPTAVVNGFAGLITPLNNA